MPVPESVPTILLAHGEPLALRTMEQALAEAGYRVFAAADAIRALELAAIMPERPALLIAAQDLQPVTGADLARLVGGPHSGTRVVLLGEPAGPPDGIDWATLLGPVPAADLVELVRRTLAEPVEAPLQP